MKTFLVISWLFLSWAASGQPSLKIYAYYQEAVPGMVPQNVGDENGNPVNRKKEPGANYYIFAGYSPSLKITFSQLWISGKLYRITTNKTDSTPVIHINDNDPAKPIKEVLVPFTRLKITAIQVKEIIAEKKSRPSWLNSMIRKSDLVISWYYKGVKYYSAVKKFKILLPLEAI